MSLETLSLQIILITIFTSFWNDYMKLVGAVLAFLISQVSLTVKGDTMWNIQILLFSCLIQIGKSSLLLANVLSLLLNYCRLNNWDDSEVSTQHLSLPGHSLPIYNIAFVEIIF